jgi:hypothetical protein
MIKRFYNFIHTRDKYSTLEPGILAFLELIVCHTTKEFAKILWQTADSAFD